MVKLRSTSDIINNNLLQGMVVLALIGNLIAAGELLSFWEPGETYNIGLLQSGEHQFYLPALLMGLMKNTFGLDHLALRFPGILLFLGSLGSFYFVLKDLFGKETLLTFLIILSSSILLVNVCKFAFGDVYLFSFQLFSFACLLRMLKTPTTKWSVGFWISTFLGSLVHPISMGIWSAGWWLWLYYRHSKGANLKGHLLWIPYLILVGVLLFTGRINWAAPGFFFSFDLWAYGKYLLIILLACLPWLGFIPSGIKDLRYKRKKGEELSLFILGWIFLGFLSYSMMAVAGLLFLSAKQVQLCTDEKYPFRKSLQISTSFVLVLTFFGVFLLLMMSYNLFDAPGFRAAVLTGGCFWALVFLGCIGTLLRKELFMIGGFTFGGLLLSAFFWARYGPLLETKQDLPKQLIELLETPNDNSQGVVYSNDTSLVNSTKMQVYFEENGRRLELIKMSDIQSLRSDAQVLLNMEQAQSTDSTITPLNKEIKGHLNIFDEPKTISSYSAKMLKNFGK